MTSNHAPPVADGAEERAHATEKHSLREVDRVERFLPFVRERKPRWHTSPHGWVQALTAPVVVPVRFVLLMMLVLFYYLVCVALGPRVRLDSTGAREVLTLPPWRFRALRRAGKAGSWLLLRVMGFWRIQRDYLPGYDASHRRYATVVCNHISLCDIVFFMADNMCAFVSKHGMLQVPLVGRIAASMGCIFVNRSQKGAGHATQWITEWQTRLWRSRLEHTEPAVPPLAMFPEGTTTNGQFLLRFRTGAFVSGLPVQPVVLAYPNAYFSLAYETIRGWRFLLGLLSQHRNHLCVIYFPLYVPSAEERNDPALYAEHVRRLMLSVLAREYGVRPSDSTYADKLAYHDIVRASWRKKTPTRSDTKHT